jgi:mycofactocin precursor
MWSSGIRVLRAGGTQDECQGGGMADDPAGVMTAQVLVAEPPADQPLLADDLRAEDLLAGDLLVEEISIDGMCGVY